MLIGKQSLQNYLPRIKKKKTIHFMEVKNLKDFSNMTLI